MASADRESQQVFGSISNIGHFRGAGIGGVGGCTRWFILSGDVDVLQHYREVLPAAGWEVVEDDGRRLRASVMTGRSRRCPALEAVSSGLEARETARSDRGTVMSAGSDNYAARH